MSHAPLRLDTQLLYKKGPITYGISSETMQATTAAITAAVSAVESELENKTHAFVTTLEDDQQLQEIQSAFEQISWAKTLVVIGIGGSDLGARAIQQALESENPPQQVIFHGDSTDPVALDRLLLHLDLSTTVFNVISKSGETVETISQYVYLKGLVQKITESWQKHFLFTTDAQQGILREEAAHHGVPTLPIPDSIGGRFSVLTSVGLLPALSMGVSIQELVTGARDCAAHAEMRQLAQTLATTQYQLYQQGTKVTVCMPYSVQLEEFARWFRQLWAESLGKDGKGILPIQARGPADQHSQVQFYAQGTPLLSLLFMRLEHRKNERVIAEVSLPAAEYLNGHSFHEVITIEQTATALALAKAGRPSATLSLEQLDASTLGALFMLFELAVVYLGHMLQVNTFDQPGVEEGKTFMYGLLGRKDFAHALAEIESLQHTLKAE